MQKKKNTQSTYTIRVLFFFSRKLLEKRKIKDDELIYLDKLNQYFRWWFPVKVDWANGRRNFGRVLRFVSYRAQEELVESSSDKLGGMITELRYNASNRRLPDKPLSNRRKTPFPKASLEIGARWEEHGWDPLGQTMQKAMEFTCPKSPSVMRSSSSSFPGLPNPQETQGKDWNPGIAPCRTCSWKGMVDQPWCS